MPIAKESMNPLHQRLLYTSVDLFVLDLSLLFGRLLPMTAMLIRLGAIVICNDLKILFNDAAPSAGNTGWIYAD